MADLLDDAQRLALLNKLNPDAYQALHWVLALHEEQPDMPLSATARRLLEAPMPDGLRAELTRFQRYAEAAEAQQPGGAT